MGKFGSTTQSTYATALRQWAEWGEGQGWGEPEPDLVTVYDMEDFARELEGRGMARSSVALKLGVVLNFIESSQDMQRKDLRVRHWLEKDNFAGTPRVEDEDGVLCPKCYWVRYADQFDPDGEPVATWCIDCRMDWRVEHRMVEKGLLPSLGEIRERRAEAKEQQSSGPPRRRGYEFPRKISEDHYDTERFEGHENEAEKVKAERAAQVRAELRVEYDELVKSTRERYEQSMPAWSTANKRYLRLRAWVAVPVFMIWISLIVATLVFVQWNFFAIVTGAYVIWNVRPHIWLADRLLRSRAPGPRPPSPLREDSYAVMHWAGK